MSDLTFKNGGFKDLDIRDYNTIEKVVKIVDDYSDDYSIDFSDAFQLVSLKYGCFSSAVDGSKTILITQDENLSNIAVKMDIRVWLFNKETMPSPYSEV